MRFETRGELPRVDLSPLWDLVPTIRSEWEELRFDRDGHLLHPRTGEPVHRLGLVTGEHRHPGTIYLVTIDVPVREVPDELESELMAEAIDLTERDAGADAWQDHRRRREQGSVTVGTKEEHVLLSLRRDDATRTELRLGGQEETWTVDVSISWAASAEDFPRLDLDVELDLTAMLSADQTPGCVASLLGGRARGHAAVDGGALSHGGAFDGGILASPEAFVEGSGRANRFRGAVDIGVDAEPTVWRIEASATLRAKGLARPFLWFGRTRIRSAVDDGLRRWWATGRTGMADLGAQLEALRRATEAEGGAVPFVDRLLWDDDFDPDLDFLRP